MENIILILTVAIVHLGIVIVPGPNFLIVTKNSLTHSRHVGLVTAQGVALGTIVYVIAGFLGFTALLAQSVVLFNVVKWIGTAYFVYVGIRLIRSSVHNKRIVDTLVENPFSDRQALQSGLLTMLSNVKSAFYFMLLFTTFVPANITTEVRLSLLVVIPTISLIWYSIIAWTFSNHHIRGFYRRIERGINIVFGGLWILLGIKLATSTRS